MREPLVFAWRTPAPAGGPGCQVRDVRPVKGMHAACLVENNLTDQHLRAIKKKQVRIAGPRDRCKLRPRTPEIFQKQQTCLARCRMCSGR